MTRYENEAVVTLTTKEHCWNCEKDLAIGTRAWYEESYETTYNPETGQIDGTAVSAGFECEPCHWE
jgi:hypothetical protein